jgi:hypothetical protein
MPLRRSSLAAVAMAALVVAVPASAASMPGGGGFRAGIGGFQPGGGYRGFHHLGPRSGVGTAWRLGLFAPYYCDHPYAGYDDGY